MLPLKKFSIKEINEISRKFCAQHLQKSLGSCRVIKVDIFICHNFMIEFQQRHYVEAFPIAKVHYKLDSKSGVFYVYGNERLCYIPKAPSKCSLM